MKITVGARSSRLSRAQVAEIAAELKSVRPDVELMAHYVETIGDRDKKTSLRTLGKSDFFTRELDRQVLEEQVRVAVHSAKDLPDPLPDGLAIVALTAGVDPRDCVVLREGEEILPHAVIATSSERREAAVRELFDNVQFVDVRGTIDERLQLLEKRFVDGLVMAEAAIARLKLSHLNRRFLKGPAAELQGRLAVIAQEKDKEMRELFAAIDAKKRPWTVLYLGLDPASCPSKGRVYHYPVIRTRAIEGAQERIKACWKEATHLLFTSKSAVAHLPKGLCWEGKIAIAIGEATASLLPEALVATTSTQEGVGEIVKRIEPSARLLWPRSSRSRSYLAEMLQSRQAEIVDLYETQLIQPGSPPPLDEIDEIVFMSPSCVEGFQKIYGAEAPKKKITVQGPITAQACRKFFGRDILQRL